MKFKGPLKYAYAALAVIVAMVIIVCAFLVIGTQKAHAQSGASLWKLSGVNLSPVNATWNLKIPGLNTTGAKRCVNVLSTGVLEVAAAECGTGGGGGSGDFVGPASSTDNAVVRFDGTTGKLGQNSDVTIDDSENIDNVASLDIDLSGALSFGATNILTDAAGVTTLSNIDGINSTTENTLEAAIDIAGDVTGTGLTAVAITNDAVTYAKMQNVSATNRLLGRSTAGAGDVEEITVGGDITQSGSTFTIGANTVALTTDTVGDYVSSATASGGLVMTGTEGGSLGVLLPAATNGLSATTSSGSGLELLSGGLTLLQGCADTEILKWNETTDLWACAADGGSGGIPTQITVADESADTSSFVSFFTDATGDLGPKTNANFTFNAASGLLSVGRFTVSSNNFTIGSSLPFSDSAGTLTLQNIDVLDATTESTIESAVDTLANLTSVQGHTLTLTGALIRSGAHSLTLTSTGTTNVTLPTTGTLATLAGTEALTNKDLTATSNTIADCTDPIWFGDQFSDLTTGTNKGYFLIAGGQAATITSVRGRLITAATGATLVTVDINENGTSILSTKLTFDASEKTTATAATAAVISDSSWAADSEGEVDVDAVGNTTPGNGGFIEVCYTY